ncbi:MAG TPA: TRIC cation channel family protein, partial [Nitrososphaera sp.]
MSADVGSLLIQALDLFGTMAFAVTGAFKAIEHKSDIVGIIILATITGVAGGVLR